MKQYIIMDAHCDTAGELLDKQESLFSNSGHLSLEMMQQYGGYVQFFAAWVSKDVPNPILRTLAILDNFKREIEENQQSIMEVKCVQDIFSAITKGKRGAILAIEDARALCGSLVTLRVYHALGVRALTLAWNDDNDVTGGANSIRGIGLTDFGKQVVQEMNRLHMMIDVSHISQKGFWDVLSISSAPVMASHSNCMELCHHPRNLEDEQIKALIETNGFLGINLYPPFLSQDGKADIKTILSHIEHILALGGENILGLGSDFDGVDCLPNGISNAAEYVHLLKEMTVCGYSDALIDKITHQNMINFMKRIEK